MPNLKLKMAKSKRGYHGYVILPQRKTHLGILKYILCSIQIEIWFSISFTQKKEEKKEEGREDGWMIRKLFFKRKRTKYFL